MKKNHREEERETKPRRLLLSRETIKALDEPALLGLARGGYGFSAGCGPIKTYQGIS